MWRRGELRGGGVRRCSTMADQLYLENIDEFVMDQNKIVRNQEWGTRACDWDSGPGEGGGGLDPLASDLVGTGQGKQVPLLLVPQGKRGPAREGLGARAGPRPLGGRAGRCTD